MVKKEGSKTLIVVCRQAFARVIERVLRRERFGDFQRGDISLAGGMAVAARRGDSEVFVLTADADSARRLAQILRACPLRGRPTDFFELYTIDHEL